MKSIGNYRYGPPKLAYTWNINGKVIQWIQPQHFQLLVGYDDNNYIFNDPQLGAKTYFSKAATEIGYKALFRQAVVIVKNSAPSEGTNLLNAFSKNNAELSDVMKSLEKLLDDYLNSISPPRYCGKVEITSKNKNSFNTNGENIYLFLYNWYSEHIWSYEKMLPQGYESAHNPMTAEGCKRAALDDWMQKVYGSTTWQGIVNGFDNFVESLYYELVDIKGTLTAAAKQIVGGNYSDDVTITGTAGQITLSILGVDLVADVRDVVYDVSHWEWTWSHAGQTGIDLIGLLPIVGAVKNLDEVNIALKHADSLSSLAKNSDELTLLYKNIDDYVAIAKKSGAFQDIAKNTELWAKVATNPGSSNLVVLGKYIDEANPKSYQKVAIANKATFFQLPEDLWNDLNSVLKREEMWEINKSFLNTQFNAKKVFAFSHNPWKADGFFQDEVLHLIDLGAKDFVKEGDLWIAVF